MKKKPRKQMGPETIVPIGDWFPDEIVGNILQKLPDKSLMRFLCVSKKWCSMISDPKLIMNTQKLLLVYPASMKVMEYNAYRGNTRKVKFGPLLNSRQPFEVWGSSNGLLLIAVYLSWSLYIWNPVTGESKKLPHLENNLYSSFGFGYDHSTDDYKIVNLRQYMGGDIYSMRRNSWRSVGDIPCSGADIDVYRKGGILANNALHWHVIYKGTSLQTIEGSCIICLNGDIDNSGRTAHLAIFRFDLVEEAGMLILPSHEADNESEYELMDFKGCLCAIQNQNGSSIEMWILRGKNTLLSWMKLMTIPGLEQVPEMKFLAPIYFSRNGEILLNIRPDSIVHRRLQYPRKRRTTIFYSYNPKEKTFKRVRVRGIRSWTSEITYGENLVSLN
ncbi:putative F-box family protein [Quillaja saponaria]|uniref:F-box family protein n=1 Tax=Quillaja saponaria TaxID=32244 RepID=A0AAD7PW57_QUISA|nr:putative F-box family protein [Quillaja saponaria]